MQHYVFGYGSLICSESRAATANALGGSNSSSDSNSDGTQSGTTGRAIPVRLHNWVRLWNVRGPNTYLGVEKCATDNQCSCVGVLVPIPSSDSDNNKAVLEALDRREHAYARQKVHLGSIERVDDLLIGEDFEDKYYTGTFWGNQQQQVPKNNNEAPPVGITEDTTTQDVNEEEDDEVCVWIYVPLEQYTGMARPENTILQSYVDVCLKGCLSISQAFAKEFVRGTYGWYQGHTYNATATSIAAAAAASTAEEADDLSKSSCWVDDRENPVYIRADKEYSLRHSQKLDAVFDPTMLSRWRQE